jgi:hypothetical protein
MQAGVLINHENRNELSSKLIWLAGAIAVCRGLLATAVPTLRSILNL